MKLKISESLKIELAELINKAYAEGFEAGKKDKDALDALAYSTTTLPTRNQQRAELIQKAKYFVSHQFMESQHGAGQVVNHRGIGHCKVEFIVNYEKRTVTALLRLAYFGTDKIQRRGIAKCRPDEVFNADIGKAIALARALSIYCPSEFLDAVQPSEAVDGQIITFPKTDRDGWYRKVCYRINGVDKRVDNLIITKQDIDASYIGLRAVMGEGLGKLVIIDDTEAVYDA